MILQEAISILKIHQEWRLGADIVMIEPKELTEAIDVILKEVENLDEQLEQQWKKGWDEATTQAIKETHKYQ
jgi:prephenate dehydrogenase